MPPEPPPKRPRRRWLRRLALAAFALLLFLGVVLGLALRNLEWIARFAIHRAFPGVILEVGSLRAASATRLEARKLALRSAKTHETLLSLEGGLVVFSFGEIWRARLDEVRLKSPVVTVSPDLGEALGIRPGPAGPAPGGKPPPKWAIGRLVVTDGRLFVTRFGKRSPSAKMEFSLDLRNFGVGGDFALVEHSARLANLSAEDAAGQRFLEIESAEVRFTTEELFAGDRLRAVRIGSGSLTVNQSLLDSFQFPGPGGPTPSGGPRPGWAVGALDLAGVDIVIPDAQGPIGRATFHVAARLRELGAIGTPEASAEQTLTISRISVATDREPARPLLTAKRARARFTLAGLAAHRLEELNFENTAIDFAPSAFASAPAASTSPAAAGGPAKASPPAPWIVAHAVGNYGTLRLRGIDDGALGVTASFAFDLHDLGTIGDAARRPHEITIWDVQAAAATSTPFFTMDVGSLTFTTAGLLAQKRIEAVKIDGGRLLVGDAIRRLLAPKPSSAAPPASTPAPDDAAWTIGALEIAGVRTRIEDARPGVTDLHFTLNTSLRNVRASGASSEVLEEVQTIEFANIDLRSPLNRTAKILSLRSVFVRFTLGELARQHLREVVILQPTIFLSQDLFVYMERAAAAPAAPASPSTISAAPAGPNWSVDHLEVKFGRLVIGSGGSKDVGLPLEFETAADNLDLDNLAALQLQTVLRVKKQSREFPDYQLAVEDVEGDLRFSYPPEKGEKNLVQKLEIGSVRWRQYRTRQAWVAATFDARGINGLFGGSAYGGYVNGGFSFFFQDDSPWIGWVAGTHIDTKSLTDVIAPQNFSLTGPLDFELQLDAFRKDISRMRGVFHLTEPGRLKIGKLDDLLANIPPEWTAIKQSSTRIALETMRDFDYTTATGDFWFVKSQGILNLDLLGPNGSRKFEVALHDGEESSNQWQQGKLGKK